MNGDEPEGSVYNSSVCIQIELDADSQYRK